VEFEQMSKITKTSVREYLKSKLETDEKWALKGMLRIYDYQTLDERAQGNTCHNNDVGFSCVDSKILSSFAEQYQIRKFLTPKQMQIVMKKMHKYWNQLLRISDEKVLLRTMVKDGVLKEEDAVLHMISSDKPICTAAK